MSGSSGMVLTESRLGRDDNCATKAEPIALSIDSLFRWKFMTSEIWLGGQGWNQDSQIQNLAKI